ncbi:MAG: hypothetical protein WCB11_18205, partial [Terriglobales bacterium]
IMGRGIAYAAALGSYRTILEHLLPDALRKPETEIRANLDKAVELGKVLTIRKSLRGLRLYSGLTVQRRICR